VQFSATFISKRPLTYLSKNTTKVLNVSQTTVENKTTEFPNYCAEQNITLKKDGTCPKEDTCAKKGKGKCAIAQPDVPEEPTRKEPEATHAPPAKPAATKPKAKSNNGKKDNRVSALPISTQLNSYGFIKVPNKVYKQDLGYEQEYAPGDKAKNQNDPVFPILDVDIMDYDRKTHILRIKVKGVNSACKKLEVEEE
jgi:hypothetical protein